MQKGNMAENDAYLEKANKRDGLNVTLGGTQAEQK
jgi:hypothetical protein